MVIHVRHQFDVLAIAMGRLAVELDESTYAARLEPSIVRVAELTTIRTVVDFFNNDAGRYGTNMTADDYAPGWDPRSSPIKRTLDDLAHAITRINERAMHIDVARSRSYAPLPRDSTIRANINALMREFFGCIDEEWQGCFYPSLEVAFEVIHASDPSGPPYRLAFADDHSLLPRSEWPDEEES